MSHCRLLPPLLFVLTLQAVTAELCRGDPNHQVGESWTCDDACFTCTCAPDGTIHAGDNICDQGGDQSTPPEEQFETTVVRLALAFCFVFIVCCAAVCFMMCVRGGSKNASTLVREMHEAEEE